jgi:hypothetical protein
MQNGIGIGIDILLGRNKTPGTPQRLLQVEKKASDAYIGVEVTQAFHFVPRVDVRHDKSRDIALFYFTSDFSKSPSQLPEREQFFFGTLNHFQHLKLLANSRPAAICTGYIQVVAQQQRNVTSY